MSYTFFDDKSEYSGDQITLTRFFGGTVHGRCLQISFKRKDAPFDQWFKHGHITLNMKDAKVLRDQLDRFIAGVSDGDSVGTFQNPMTSKELERMKAGRNSP